MPTNMEIQEVLSNEARRQELRLRISSLQGSVNAINQLVSRELNETTEKSIQINTARAALVLLETGAGVGITADFGPKSIVTQLLENERMVAKAAVIDFIKANANCTELEASNAWDLAAAASHASVPLPLQNGAAMGMLYRQNLFAALLIPASTWEAQRAWIIATPKAVIMAS